MPSGFLVFSTIPISKTPSKMEGETAVQEGVKSESTT